MASVCCVFIKTFVDQLLNYGKICHFKGLNSQPLTYQSYSKCNKVLQLFSFAQFTLKKNVLND